MMEKRKSLSQKISEYCKQDESFKHAHRMVQTFMAVWAAIILMDRLIGFAMGAYEESQKIYVLGGAVLLIAIAWLGTRGHLTIAMMFMQINMAVFCLQFVSVCVYYTGQISTVAALFYAVSGLVLVTISLLLFLNHNLENYRMELNYMQGKDKSRKKPFFYRTNTRLVRNKK